MKITTLITGKSYRFMAIALLFLTACTKDDVQQTDSNNTNGITAIVNNNFSLSLYGYALTATHYSDTLSKPGPFTTICPSNTAFTAAGYASGTVIIAATGVMNTIIPYGLFKQTVKFNSLPLAFNQPLPTANGQPVYVTRWQNSRDTAVIVNGVRISSVDKPAANGLINIADGLIRPIVFKDVQEAVSGDPSLTFFNAAIIRADMAATLKTASTYTLFAPVNSAFAVLGINSVDDVNKQDPAVLKTLVRAHMAAGRNFVYDYILRASVTTNTYQQTMDNGMSATMLLIADPTLPGRFTSVSVTGTRPAAATISKPNVLAGNGVVHSINSVLTQ